MRGEDDNSKVSQCLKTLRASGNFAFLPPEDVSHKRQRGDFSMQCG